MQRKVLLLTTIFQCFYILAICQSNRTLNEYSTNFIGTKLGIGYPFYSVKEKQYQFSNNQGNYAFLGAIDLGHKFNSGVSLSFSPMLIYSKFVNRSFGYTTQIGDVLIEYLDGKRSYDQVSVFFPVFVEVDIGANLAISGGGFLSKQIAASGIDWSEGKRYYFYNEEHDVYIPYSQPKNIGGGHKKYDYPSNFTFGGWQLRVSYVINTKKNKEWTLSLEYFNSLVSSSKYGAYEKWVNLILSKRIHH